MVDKTPLQELNEAIEKFARDTNDEEPSVMTGWILGYTTLRYGDSQDGYLPDVHGIYYSLGPQTSVAQAAGTVMYLDTTLRRAMSGEDGEL